MIKMIMSLEGLQFVQTASVDNGESRDNAPELQEGLLEQILDPFASSMRWLESLGRSVVDEILNCENCPPGLAGAMLAASFVTTHLYAQRREKVRRCRH